MLVEAIEKVEAGPPLNMDSEWQLLPTMRSQSHRLTQQHHFVYMHAQKSVNTLEVSINKLALLSYCQSCIYVV